jgi:hypothetical protein
VKNLPIALDGPTLQFMLEQPKPIALIGLYCVFAKYEHQKDDKDPITIERLQELSGMSKLCFYKWKDTLESLNLIKFRRTKANQASLELDVEVLMVRRSRARTRRLNNNSFPDTPLSPPKGERGYHRGEGRWVDGLFSNTNKPKPKWSTNCARKLYRMLARRRKIMTSQVNMEAWARCFTNLTRHGYSKTHVNKILSWYCSHFGDDYVPDARSASTFARKFLQIESAMERSVKDNKATTSQTVYIEDDDPNIEDQDNPVISGGDFDVSNLNGESFIGG